MLGWNYTLHYCLITFCTSDSIKFVSIEMLILRMQLAYKLNKTDILLPVLSFQIFAYLWHNFLLIYELAIL